jgi:acylphosphatase
MKQAHILVSGRVHGVFFRATTRDKARQLGLKGFVRNLVNGDVEVVAQGEQQDLYKLLEFCRQGPPGAEVEGIDIEYKDVKEKFNGFDIKF